LEKPQRLFGIAAQQMRRILVDYARSHRAAKRRGSARRISLEQAVIVSKEDPSEILVYSQFLLFHRPHTPVVGKSRR
jgi:ECF sigma factor